MALQGIDVSNWQNGIDLSAVGVDFVICKATQGTSYVSPDCDRQMQQAMRSGRLVGVYHYINGAGVDGEARHFANSIKGYLGKAIIALDWESEQNSAWGNTSYLDSLVAKVKELTGVTPFIYASLSAFPWSIAQKYGCGTWVAQYANMNATGLQANPWNEGAYTCDIRQYSSCGRLGGYGGNLDLNKAYMSREDWQRWSGGAASGGTTSTPEPSSPSDSVLSLAVGVMQGKYGNGDARKAALGNRYDEVQAFINHIASASVATLANEVMRGDYGNGDTRKIVLGNRYNEVQAQVNRFAGTSVATKDAQTLAKEVIQGKYGNGEARRKALGNRYDEVQAIVNKIA